MGKDIDDQSNGGHGSNHSLKSRLGVDHRSNGGKPNKQIIQQQKSVSHWSKCRKIPISSIYQKKTCRWLIQGWKHCFIDINT